MPPLKHSRLGESEVINWMCKEFKIDAKLADAVFSSARHAKYVVMYNGRWRGDSLIGFFNWKDGGVQSPKPKKPEQNHDPEEEEQQEPVVLSDDKPMSLEEAKANFQRLKQSLGL
jgi:hypothetical protein